MQIAVSPTIYFIAEQHLESLAVEYFGKILTPSGSTGDHEVYFHGAGVGEAYDEESAKTHLTAFSKALESYEKPKEKKKK